jgi:hypothetical protein
LTALGLAPKAIDASGALLDGAGVPRKIVMDDGFNE